MLKKRLFISYTVLISLFMIVVLTAVNRAVSGTIDTQMESVTREAVEVGVRDINSLFSDMFSETLNLCVDRQLQAALTDFADGGGEMCIRDRRHGVPPHGRRPYALQSTPQVPRLQSAF